MLAEPVIVPVWWELAIDGRLGQRPGFAHQEFAPGPLSYAVLLRHMASRSPKGRQAVARTVLTMMGEHGFDAALFAACAIERIPSRDVHIAGLAATWELMADEGGLRLLWPAALAITSHAVNTRPLPPGTHELLSWLRRYLLEVPDDVSMPAIAAFAQQRGSTKAHFEARALIADAKTAVSA